jgi:hypothetical protein
MELWEVLVPKADNDGNEYSLNYHRTWDTIVREMCGGLTIMRSAKGVWVDGSDVYEERMIPVRITCDRETLMEILKATKTYYRQIAIFACKVSEEVIIYK